MATKIVERLTYDRLREFLTYNPETGEFFWAVHTRARPIGKRAGSISAKNGYRSIYLLGFNYQEHRLAWMYSYGAMPEVQVDHINGVRSDNRLANLRLATSAQNRQNQRHAHTNNNSTGVLGVTFCKERQKFLSQIVVNGKHHFLGRFRTIEEASEAYVLAKRRLHEFGTL